MATEDQTPRPCKLQVNTSGAWRNVLDFDAKDEAAVLHSAADLFAYGGKATLRIIMPGDTAPLMAWSLKDGWREFWKAVA
jgi:hypothetical protein